MKDVQILVVSVCFLLLVVGCTSGERAKPTEVSAKDLEIDKYVPGSRKVDTIITVNGLSFAVFPNWSIEKSGDMIRFGCVDDKRVILEFLILKSGSELTESGYERRIYVKGLDTDLHYDMNPQEEGATHLTGELLTDDLRVEVKGFFFETSEADKRRAGELWQIVNWMYRSNP